MTKNHVFPSSSGGVYYFGLSTREYFAATAPKPPDDWFSLEPKPEFNSLKGSLEDHRRYRINLRNWMINREVEWRKLYAEAMVEALGDDG